MVRKFGFHKVRGLYAPDGELFVSGPRRNLLHEVTHSFSLTRSLTQTLEIASNSFPQRFINKGPQCHVRFSARLPPPPPPNSMSFVTICSNITCIHYNPPHFWYYHGLIPYAAKTSNGSELSQMGPIIRRVKLSLYNP
jgi:hypothetical protein